MGETQPSNMHSMIRLLVLTSTLATVALASSDLENRINPEVQEIEVEDESVLAETGSDFDSTTTLLSTSLGSSGGTTGNSEDKLLEVRSNAEAGIDCEELSEETCNMLSSATGIDGIGASQYLTKKRQDACKTARAMGGAAETREKCIENGHGSDFAESACNKYYDAFVVCLKEAYGGGKTGDYTGN